MEYSKLDWKTLRSRYSWRKNTLTHFTSLVSFYTPWKYQTTRSFLIFSGGMERSQWHEIISESLGMNELVFSWSVGRSSRSQMFLKIIVLTNFTIFTGKHLCWILFRPLKACNFINRLQQRRFPANIVKFLRTDFLWNTSGGSFCIG